MVLNNMEEIEDEQEIVSILKKINGGEFKEGDRVTLQQYIIDNIEDYPYGLGVVPSMIRDQIMSNFKGHISRLISEEHCYVRWENASGIWSYNYSELVKI